MQRVSCIVGHISANATAASPGLSSKSPDDVVICAAVRTPITRFKKGGLASLHPEDMLAPLFQAVVDRTGVDMKSVGECCIGTVLGGSVVGISARMAQMQGGVPIQVPTSTVNRQCSSGLQAVASVSDGIKAGRYDIGLAGGVESMSLFDIRDMIDPARYSEVGKAHEIAGNCLVPMGITAENISEKYGIKREQMDAFALASHAKASAAQKAGRFAEEMVPFEVLGKVVDKDDGVRPETTMESLAKMKPAFKDTGSTTAANASQISDGASLVLLARRSAAEAAKLPILATFVGFEVAGVPPELMGIGPIEAVPKLLSRCGVSVDDIDLWEMNEAFASQAVFCAEHLKVDPAKINVNGGAIALGHPLGSTGARLIATILPELKRRGAKQGVVTMCVGTGMGAAALVRLE